MTKAEVKKMRSILSKYPKVGVNYNDLAPLMKKYLRHTAKAVKFSSSFFL